MLHVKVYLAPLCVLMPFDVVKLQGPGLVTRLLILDGLLSVGLLVLLFPIVPTRREFPKHQASACNSYRVHDTFERIFVYLFSKTKTYIQPHFFVCILYMYMHVV